MEMEELSQLLHKKPLLSFTSKGLGLYPRPRRWQGGSYNSMRLCSGISTAATPDCPPPASQLQGSLRAQAQDKHGTRIRQDEQSVPVSAALCKVTASS